jgi:hypothetical protein
MWWVRFWTYRTELHFPIIYRWTEKISIFKLIIIIRFYYRTNREWEGRKQCFHRTGEYVRTQNNLQYHSQAEQKVNAFH